MNLPQDKRAQMLVLIASTAMVLLLLWAFLIRIQQEDLNAKISRRKQINEALEKSRNKIKLAGTFRQDLNRVTTQLQELEEGVASGDPYLWIIKMLTRFQETTEITISNFGPPVIQELPGAAKIPYKSATFSVSGTGFYHEINRFLHELEKQYPMIRLERLELDPASTQSVSVEDHERLAFKLEVTTLLKPGTSLNPSKK